MNKKSNMQKEVREFLEVVGALAEVALNFYRALLEAGANNSEAISITRAYLASFNIPATNSSSSESEE